MQEEAVPRSCSAAEVCGRPLTLQGCESTLAAADGSPSISRCSSWDDSTASSGSSSPKGSVEGTVALGLPPHAQGALRPQLAQAFAFPSVAQGALRSTSISTSPPTRVRARSATAPYQRNSSQGRLPPLRSRFGTRRLRTFRGLAMCALSGHGAPCALSGLGPSDS